MQWQLWVLIAAAASGVAAVLLVKFSQAQEVFERIVEPASRPRPDRTARPRPDRADATVDDLIKYRRRQEPRLTWFPQPAHQEHRTRGHH
ncbi:hypothetical protein OHA70_06760 [Kribbella sp. NBC_00382]|uniref:hypothetical protein n=1 Tax=Kribbella sp. NBC_00382 TaxID=2975967 RepID=UPI002E224910